MFFHALFNHENQFLSTHHTNIRSANRDAGADKHQPEQTNFLEKQECTENEALKHKCFHEH